MGRRLGKLQKWSRACAPNFAAQCLIAEAERARVRGQADAPQKFEEAIAAARQHEAPLREALARELYSRCLRERGQTAAAEEQRHAASDAYARWGALVKVEALRSA
jgi:hypothetical protein